ncbi:MAG: energy transducer TonB [Acidobacteriia bacterium]|nr:energy transducer TonB [Terriglobia bacterium]
MSLRECQASLQWKEENIVVAEKAAQIDLDLFGVDLSKDGAVAAFQIKKTPGECCASYQIYSLEKRPRLLRTITGGSYFTASDKDLDGRIEIWTDDSAAMNGLDGLQVAYVDYPPAYVLRFENGRLLDASGEFQDYFDGIAGRVRDQIKPDSLREFQLSDGRLQPDSSSDFERISRLRAVKIQALEIVWAYLYSGREQEAWHALAEMWPAGDAERIRREVTNARANGILAQVDSVSTTNGQARKKPSSVYKQSEVTPAKAIYLWRPSPSNPLEYSLLETEVVLDLVIDSAGKVSSAAPVGKEGTADAALLSAAKEWKFIPGLKNGHSVASRLRLYTSLRR